MRLCILTIAVYLAGCSSSVGESPEGTPDARPITFKEPPKPKDGTATKPGCNGVTSRGECQDELAVHCDLDRGLIAKVDCKALNQKCVEDSGRGAICTTLDGGGTTGSACGPDVSETGLCTAEGSAVFCDTSGAEPKARSWKCSDDGKTCQPPGEGGCADHAFCCGGEEPIDCQGLDYEGTCDGTVAKWCDPSAGLVKKDCTTTGQRCEEGDCTEGAFCCGAISGNPEAEACAAVGFLGECTNASSGRYCLSGTFQTFTCTGNTECNTNCGLSAGCCPTDNPPPPANECTALGYKGECKDSTTVRLCTGEVDADIEEFTCTDGQMCGKDETGYADCRDEVDPCNDLDAAGICDGEILKYCIEGSLVEIDCAQEEGDKTCQVDACTAKYAECCPPA